MLYPAELPGLSATQVRYLSGTQAHRASPQLVISHGPDRQFRGHQIEPSLQLRAVSGGGCVAPEKTYRRDAGSRISWVLIATPSFTPQSFSFR